MGIQHEKTYTLNTYDFDVKRNVRLVTLMNFLQDISTMHYESVTQDNHIKTQGLWVIVDWEVELMNQQVKLGPVSVMTEPVYFRKFIAYRRYEIKDQAGQIIARALSKWAYIENDTHKQANIPLELYALFGVSESAEKPPKMGGIRSFDPSDSYETSARFSDIDVNDHVNNVAYIKWLIDGFDKSFLETHYPSKLWIGYKREVNYGQTVRVNHELCDNNESHHEINFDDGSKAVQAIIEWQKR